MPHSGDSYFDYNARFGLRLITFWKKIMVHYENGCCFQGHGDNKESQQRNGFGCSRRPRL